VNGYRAIGWQVDDAVLKALASVESAAHIDVVSAAIRAMYLPWLEDSARYLQALFTDSAYPWNSTSKAQQPQFSEGDCVLFVDGLRFDLAKRLCSSLHGKGYTITEQPLWAAIPSERQHKAAVTRV
jgi:ABC-type amino acid transport substrate-binding protein